MWYMLVPWQALNMKHQRTAQYKKGEEQKRRRLVVEEERVVTSWSFSAYVRPLEMVTSFRYLGRVISEAGENWPVVIRNLEKAQAVWRSMMRILSREGERLRVSGFFRKAVFQLVFLFSA